MAAGGQFDRDGPADAPGGAGDEYGRHVGLLSGGAADPATHRCRVAGLPRGAGRLGPAGADPAASGPPRDEYLLADAGRDLLPVLTALRVWGERYATPARVAGSADPDPA
ncbi:winged helix-turn-helix transcriptional regulator [Streptomyces sp. NBC_01198]|uniref:winged helix-turn-helix transcriptional regulator n=1 Tax=Streptomyces sp. NBC_01198 TaxID=2903769 RepID=UPI002E147548|nr:winged helix-turn-helix transcriptional regulator [Streptomyces sp. NBC_01198]